MPPFLPPQFSRKSDLMKDKKKKNKSKDVLGVESQSVESTHTVARVTEIIASSPKSFEDAVTAGVTRACKTLQNVTGAWIQDQKVDIEDGQITAYRVTLKVTFVLND